VSILNDGKYGWDYKDNTLRLSLLRSPIWPDSTADRGRHRFRFAIYPHAGDWRRARTVERAAEYNVPMPAAIEPAHDGPLGRSWSLASVESESVHLAWVKRGEDADQLVLRLVEWHGRPSRVDVSLACDIAAAQQANLLEDPQESLPVEQNRIRLSLRPYQITTLLVNCAS
jgi:alpha-mannosidase